MTRVIVLRPEPGASETVEKARALGLEAEAIPLFAIEPLDWTSPDPARFDAILLTSANAVRHGGPHLSGLQNLPVHAVGEATAEAARGAGFDVATVGNGGVDALLHAIAPGLRLLHLCGEDRKALASPSQEIREIAVYRSRAVEEPEGLDRVQDSLVLIHSPRAGQRLAELVDRLGLSRSLITIAAISDAAANAAGSGWADIRHVDRPTDDALLALAARLCEKDSGTMVGGVK